MAHPDPSVGGTIGGEGSTLYSHCTVLTCLASDTNCNQKTAAQCKATSGRRRRNVAAPSEFFIGRGTRVNILALGDGRNK